VHVEFQKETHHRKLDTLGKVSRKETLIAQMKQLESDIKKLSKNYIFVDTTQPSTVAWWKESKIWKVKGSYLIMWIVWILFSIKFSNSF